MNRRDGHRDAQTIARQLLAEAIERIVFEARQTGDTLRAGYHTGMLAVAYPSANFSIGRIMDELILAASKAAIPVEMNRDAVELQQAPRDGSATKAGAPKTGG